MSEAAIERFRHVGILSRVLMLVLTSITAGAQTLEAGPSPRLIIKWKASAGLGAGTQNAAQTRLRSIAEAQTRHRVGLSKERMIATGAEVVRLDRRLTPSELQSLIATLEDSTEIEYVEEDRLAQPVAFTPNDPLFAQQWHYFEPTAGINLANAWDLSSGGGVRVAVVDTGIRPHADLAENIVGGYDFINDITVANDGDARDANPLDPGDACPGGVNPNSTWHGTHVSGTIAAVTNNSIGVAGVAFNARIVPVRALGRCGGFTSDIADGIIWAAGGNVSGAPPNAQPADVINLSLRIVGSCGATMQSAIDTARSLGTVVVAAAGNDNQDAANASPANCGGVISVAATDRNGARAPYSNFGTNIDIAAPGGNVSIPANGVLSTLNSGATSPGADSYRFYEGTSMAAPHVSGVAALLLARNSSLTPDEVEARLRNTARRFPGACNLCGTGIVDAHAAIDGVGQSTLTPILYLLLLSD